MSYTQKKLTELLDVPLEAFRFTAWENSDKVAAYLLANGVEVPVRCKECVHRLERKRYLRCVRNGFLNGFEVKPDGFCNYGERDKEGYFKPGDICTYTFGEKNTSEAVVEVVKIVNAARGVAEVKIRSVVVDGTKTGYLAYLLKAGGTMNASLSCLTKIEVTADG